jgi:hypothetical protein
LAAYGFNEFRKLWRKAEWGESEFLPIFLPWSIDPEYRARLPDNFDMSREEYRLAELHGLDAEQICWRRNKISPNRVLRELSLISKVTGSTIAKK